MVDHAMWKFMHSQMFVPWNQWWLRPRRCVVSSMQCKVLRGTCQLSMVLEMWQYDAAAMNAEKFMGGAICRMLNRKLLTAWEQWQ